MQDGLYKLSCETEFGSASGVVVIRGGKMSGGDSRLFYDGAFTVFGDEITIFLEIDRHTPGDNTVFGRDKSRVGFSGRVSGSSAKLTGSTGDAPYINFPAVLTKIQHGI